MATFNEQDMNLFLENCWKHGFGDMQVNMPEVEMTIARVAGRKAASQGWSLSQLKQWWQTVGYNLIVQWTCMRVTHDLKVLSDVSVGTYHENARGE